MKKMIKFAALYMAIFCSIQVFGQQKEKEAYQQEVAQKLSMMDLSGIKTNFLLNKGLFDNDEIAHFRNKPRNKQGQVVMNTTAEEWQNLYERLSDTDLRTNGRIPDFEKFAVK
jgi:hypothetical protein